MNNDNNKIDFNLSAKDWIVISISIIALIISMRSCSVSQKSLEITNRPYLTLQPIKFPETDSYLKITDDPGKLTYSVTAQIVITNRGKTPATDVHCLKNTVFNIGPGETHSMISVMNIDKKNHKDLKTDLEWLNSGKGFITCDISAAYSSILDSSKQYRIRVSYKIFKDNVMLVGSDEK